MIAERAGVTVVGSWVAILLAGNRRRGSTWADWLGLAMGFGWVALLGANQGYALARYFSD